MHVHVCHYHKTHSKRLKNSSICTLYRNALTQTKALWWTYTITATEIWRKGYGVITAWMLSVAFFLLCVKWALNVVWICLCVVLQARLDPPVGMSASMFFFRSIYVLYDIHSGRLGVFRYLHSSSRVVIFLDFTVEMHRQILPHLVRLIRRTILKIGLRRTVWYGSSSCGFHVS